MIGNNKDQGDYFFTYAYQYLETDAVISAFSDSDFGRNGGTNTKAHILQTGYVLRRTCRCSRRPGSTNRSTTSPAATRIPTSVGRWM